MPKKSKIGCSLRKLREITGKSQVAFARALGCSSNTIKKIEAGDNSKLHRQLLMAASYVFAVSPDSLIPPSTQPIKLIDGKPYTKEFFDDWWKAAPKFKSEMQPEKAAMLRELEMVLAAAMRVPGMSIGGVMVSFHGWMHDTMTKFHLLPHYEAEWKERIKRARRKPNKLQVDLELAKLFAGNKSEFIQEAFEADVSPTRLLAVILESKKEYMKTDFEEDWEIKSKLGKLKSGSNLLTKAAQKVIQETMTANSGPKRTR